MTGVNAEEDADEEGLTHVELSPGTFPVLQPGEDVEHARPADIGAGADDFMKRAWHAAAAGAGITYEQFTGDLSDVNYSSIRAGLLEFRRSIEHYQQLFFNFQFNRPVYRFFITQAVLAGRLDLADFRRNPDNYLMARWLGQGFRWVDPDKEVRALVKAVRAGLISRTDAILLSGFEPEEVDEQMAKDNDRADELGLSHDSDGRRPEKGGADDIPSDITAGSDDATGDSIDRAGAA